MLGKMTQCLLRLLTMFNTIFPSTGMEFGSFEPVGPMDLHTLHNVQSHQGKVIYITSPLLAKEAPFSGTHIFYG